MFPYLTVQKAKKAKKRDIYAKKRILVFYPDFLNFPKPGDMKADRKLMEEAIRRFLSNRCIENRMVAEAILFFRLETLPSRMVSDAQGGANEYFVFKKRNNMNFLTLF